MKYYKLQWKEKCPVCGAEKTKQEWSSKQGGYSNKTTIGMTESTKSLKELNIILDKRIVICNKCNTKF